MMVRWFVAGMSILAVVVIAIAVPVLSHVTSPAGNERGVTRERNSSTDVLALFFSDVGLAWPRGGLEHSDSAEGAIQEFLASKGASDAVVCIPADRGISLLDEGQFPVLFETKAGNFRLFAGSHVDSEGRPYYQYFSSRSAPRLVNVSDLRSGSFRKAWRLAQKNRSGLTLDVAKSRLEIDRMYHNFGTVLPGAELQTEFRIANSGDSPVKLVGQPFTSCGCTVAEFRGDRLMLPGAAITLPVKVRAGSEGFAHNVAVHFTETPSAERREALAFRLYASQLATMELSAELLQFGAVEPGETIERKVRLSEVPTDRFAVTDIDVQGLPVEYAVKSSRSRDSLRDWIVTLTLCAAEGVGEHQGAILIHTDSRLIPEVVVRVTYTVPSRVHINPPTLVWNSIPIGAPRSQEVILSYSERVTPVQIRLKNASNDPPFEANIEASQDGTAILTVTPRAASVGPLNGVIELIAESSEWTEVICIRCAGLVTQ